MTYSVHCGDVGVYSDTHLSTPRVPKWRQTGKSAYTVVGHVCGMNPGVVEATALNRLVRRAYLTSRIAFRIVVAENVGFYMVLTGTEIVCVQSRLFVKYFY